MRPHPAQQVFGLWLNLRRVSPHQPPPRDAWQCRRRSDGAPIGGIGMRLEEFKDIRSDLNTTSSRRMITKKTTVGCCKHGWVDMGLILGLQDKITDIIVTRLVHRCQPVFRQSTKRRPRYWKLEYDGHVFWWRLRNMGPLVAEQAEVRVL